MDLPEGLLLAYVDKRRATGAGLQNGVSVHWGF